MADNVTILDADEAEVAIATDDAGAGGQVQLVKLAYSADGSATPVTADADGLEVKVSNASLTVAGTVTATAQPQRKTGAWSVCDVYTEAKTNESVVSAPGAGTALYIVAVLYNTAVAGTCKLLDGSGGTVLLDLPGLAANGGASVFFGVEAAIKLTDATALCATTTGAGNASLTVVGYTA